MEITLVANFQVQEHCYIRLYSISRYQEALILFNRSPYHYPKGILYSSMERAYQDFIKATRGGHFDPNELNKAMSRSEAVEGSTQLWIKQRKASNPKIITQKLDSGRVNLTVRRNNTTIDSFIVVDSNPSVIVDNPITIYLATGESIETIRSLSDPIFTAGKCTTGLSMRMEELFDKYNILKMDKFLRYSLTCIPTLNFIEYNVPKEKFWYMAHNTLLVEFSCSGDYGGQIFITSSEMVKNQLTRHLPSLYSSTITYMANLNTMFANENISIDYRLKVNLEHPQVVEDVRALGGVFLWEMSRILQIGNFWEEDDMLKTIQALSFFEGINAD